MVTSIEHVQDRTHYRTTQSNRAVQPDYTCQGRRLAHYAQVRFTPWRRRGRLSPQELSDRRTPSLVESLALAIEGVGIYAPPTLQMLRIADSYLQLRDVGYYRFRYAK